MARTAVAESIEPVRLGYKDIMVHLDGTAEDETRLAHAEAIATLFNARLTGLHTNMFPDPALYPGEFGSFAIAEILQAARDEGDATQKKLVQRFARLGVESEVRRIEGFPALLYHAVGTEARWSDLFVASCPSRGPSLERWGSVIETVMFESGHGLYLVPPGVPPRQAIRTVLIGWLDTREAARAVAEALPLLCLATKVELVCVQELNKGMLGGAEALANIASHLDRHRIPATVSVIQDKGTTATTLLDEAHRISADLMVIGAYGHSRLREWVLGGTTYDLLGISDLPILMAH